MRGAGSKDPSPVVFRVLFPVMADTMGPPWTTEHEQKRLPDMVHLVPGFDMS